MLTAEGCRGRRARLWESVGSDVDLILIATPWHIHYLANFYVSPNTLNVPSTSFLILERSGGTLLFADNWAARTAQDAWVDGLITFNWYNGRGPGRDRHAGVAAELGWWLRKRRPRRVAVESAHLPWVVAEVLRDLGAAMVDVTPTLREMRLRKDPDEIAAIRFAVQVAVAGHAAAHAAVQPEVTELDVYAAVHAAAVQAAGGVITMLGDFASGERRGGPPTDRMLRPGDLMIVDFFPIVRGYRADITNTYVAGQPSDAQRRYMDLLLRAKEAGEAMLRPGVTGGEVYAAVQKVFKEAGVAEHFPHHAGHALGLMHPEPPFFVPASKEPLQEGQVVTLEPGLYDPAVGNMRVEDDYLITADGFERLSNHVKGFA
ncbi:MAG TPA: aminopeptidase P family protein [Caldilineae bacterium]|nr:aminopeptidase P family protein [Caldilineae bacterium]